MPKSTEAPHPVIDEINSLPGPIGETLKNILDRRQSRIVQTPIEEASRITRLALAHTNLHRNKEAIVPRSFRGLVDKLANMFAPKDEKSLISSIVAVDCEELLHEENDLTLESRLILHLEKEFSAISPGKNPKMIAREGEPPDMALLNYLADLKRNSGAKNMTFLVNNFDSLSKEQQLSLSEFVLVRLTNNPTLNTIIFHERPISLGVDSNEGYALTEELIPPWKVEDNISI